MTTNLPVRQQPAEVPANVSALAQRASDFARQGMAAATADAYASDWRHFSQWCALHSLASLPAAPETIGLFLADEAQRFAVATLQRRLATISYMHRADGHHLDTRHPAIRTVLRGIRRVKGTSQRQAKAITLDVLRMMLDACENDLIGHRDRALLAFGFASALRRSELVELDVLDLDFQAEGVVVRIRRSKGDQDGAGEVVAVARTGKRTCPVALLEKWLAVAGLEHGRVFRAVDRRGTIAAHLSDKAVCRAVKRRVRQVGLAEQDFSGHSLRAGFATAAAAAGVEELTIARQTRHKSHVVRRYIRQGDLFRRNLALEIGM